MKLLLFLLFNHTKKHLNQYLFCSMFRHGYCSGQLWLWLKRHHFYKFDIVCTLTRVGEYRKYQHSVSVIPSGCAIGNSLDLMLVFPCTPLLLSRYRLSTVQYSTVQYCTVQHSTRAYGTVQQEQGQKHVSHVMCHVPCVTCIFFFFST